MKISRRASGFSLIELLTVITVIGVLMAILIPSVGAIRDHARKTAAKSNLRQIAIAYANYANEGGKPRTITANSIYEWAALLAQHVDFNDPAVYFFPDDPLVELAEGQTPRVVATPGSSGGNWSVDGAFAAYPLSVAVASRITASAPVSTTPIAWTRGLETSGTWRAADDANPGVYGSEGGHIAFLDGHVEFFEDLSEDDGQLIHFLNKTPTGNIQEALNPGARAFEHTGPVF